MPRQTTLTLEVLIAIAKNADRHCGAVTGPDFASAERLPRCAAVNEIGVMWQSDETVPADRDAAEQALVELLGEKHDGVRFTAIAYLIATPDRLSPAHAHTAQEFANEPANAEGMQHVRDHLERQRAMTQAATS